GIGVGTARWIVNFSMLLIAVKYLGERFALWTVIGITVTSLSVHFFESHFSIMDRNLLYDLVIGSIFLGTGIGLLMRQGVSNGGGGVIAFMIAHGKNILPGKALLLNNCFIFFLQTVVRNWKLIFIRYISQWISTTIVDFICRLTFHESYTLGWRQKA